MMKITIYKNLFLILIFVFVFSQIGWSQNADSKKTLITYTAFIKDSNGNPIRNAKVFGNQGAVKTFTDVNGFFTIKVFLNSYILIESDGFNSTTISSTSKMSDIILTKSPFLLSSKDIISMGFKNVKKGLSVGDADKIRPDDILKNDNVTRFQDILDAYGAGIKSGTNLLGIGNALVIVDGLPRDASTLLPEEIQEISFLKDVNSTVLYGSQAKNGVILVKTKRGVPNKKLVNMSIEKGINKPIGIPNYLNSKDYLTLYSEALTNDGKNPIDTALISKYNGKNPTQYPDVNYYGSDYLKSLYNTTRFVGEFSGGNNVASYYANVGWEHQDVIYKANNGVNNGSDRLKVRGNVNFNINDHIKSYIDAAFVFITSIGIRTDYFTMASTYRPNDYAPLIPVSSFDDPSITNPLIHVNGNYILGGNTLVTNNSYGINVMGELNLAGYSKTYQNYMQFNTGIIYDLEQITNGLTFRANLSFDNTGAFSEAVQNTYALYQPVWNDFTGNISSLTTINTDTKTGVLTLSSGSIARTIGTNLVFDYDKTFNQDHHISSSLVGYYTMAMIQGSLQNDKNSHLGLNVSYDYKKCYLVDFSGAMINSVKLAPGKRLSFSPSLGLGYVLSNASFWKTNNLIDYLKFRVSAGILQTDAAFGYGLYREIYSGGGNIFGTGDAGGYNSGSAYINQSANPNLGMEKMKNVNIGIETALFNKSLFINASYFVTNYADQIIQKFSYYPSFYATSLPYENFNETKYSGMDISLNYKKNWEKLSITCGLNLLYSTSENIKRDEIHNNDYQYLVGHSTDTYWGLKSLGFFTTDAEAAAANQRFGTVKKGDIKYADLDGNGYIDANDRTAIGNSSPKLTTDINFSIAYKGLSLFISASARLGYDWMMSTTEAPNKYFWVDGTTKYSDVVLNRWTEATASTATYPRLSSETSTNNFQNSDFWMRNGNDLTLSRVQLNYSFPKKLFNNLFIDGLSTYLRGSNLMYFAEDARLRQVNPWLTSTRNFAIGLKITY